jgi:peptidoglycan hydrolase-like amidase
MNKPVIEVGILSSESIRFKLNGKFRFTSGKEVSEVEGKAIIKGDSSFSLDLGSAPQNYDDFVLLEPLNEEEDSFELYHVVIGVQFHWERKENQQFKGKLKLYAENGSITAVNILPLEDYLLSVISSEMSATSSTEFLKAHAVVSRSWLLAQMEKGKKLQNRGKYESLIRNEEGYIRWYDREDHDRFDVCADDHCQRYQGITKVSSPQVYEALKTTAGEVLMYDDAICDTRYYKCCGGITEKFENVWEPVVHPYLTKVIDNKVTSNKVTSDDLTCHPSLVTDLTNEDNARIWIMGNPPAFCNTHDKQALSQVLNDYDQETQDFYRWEVSLTQSEIKALLLRKVGIDVGNVLDLIPVERGVSGRLIRLKIVGDKQTIVIGKELEIRKALSESHLYSSAFVVEKVFSTDINTNVPDAFVLKGAGWGHGVGLCQIGAAIMGNNGFSYEEILTHYFPSAVLKKIY